MLGAKSRMTWTFETPRPEENYVRNLPCKVDFVYRRPWEPIDAEGNVHKTITINV